MSKQGIKIADGFSLPLDIVTRRSAILGMSGSGKSNLAVRIAEELYRHGLPWIVIDTKGDWAGVRIAGTGPALEVPIFGGQYGDVSLDPKGGKYIANLIAEQRLTCVLDVSEFDTNQLMWGFLADFGETLLKANRDPLLVIAEEAADYIPQKTTEKGNLPRCLGVWQRFVRKGRTRGLGCMQLTQRSASLNKDTLYQAELLIALRCSGKGDREAVRGWVEHHAGSKEIVDSLPSLDDGEGWVSSPAWLRRTERMHFHRRTTFDMGATPVLKGGKRAPTKTLADVDLGKIKTAMAETIERDKANDPAELKKENAALKKQLAAKPTAAAATAKPEKVKEVPALKAADRKALEGVVAKLDKQAAAFVGELVRHGDALKKIHEAIGPEMAKGLKIAGLLQVALAGPGPTVMIGQLRMGSAPGVKSYTHAEAHREFPNLVPPPLSSTHQKGGSIPVPPRPPMAPRPRVATNGHVGPAADLPKGELVAAGLEVLAGGPHALAKALELAVDKVIASPAGNGAREREGAG